MFSEDVEPPVLRVASPRLWDVASLLSPGLLPGAFKVCIAGPYHGSGDQFHSDAGSVDNEAFSLIEI